MDRAPERGETIIGNAVRTDPGGKGSNQAIGADAALDALGVARRGGTRSILNPAPAPPHAIAPVADYVTPNETEAPSVAGAQGTLVLTLGERGARLGEEIVPAFAARVVDTT